MYFKSILAVNQCKKECVLNRQMFTEPLKGHTKNEDFRMLTKNFSRAHENFFYSSLLQFPVASILPSYKEENKSMHAHELA